MKSVYIILIFYGYFREKMLRMFVFVAFSLPLILIVLLIHSITYILCYFVLHYNSQSLSSPEKTTRTHAHGMATRSLLRVPTKNAQRPVKMYITVKQINQRIKQNVLH